VKWSSDPLASSVLLPAQMRRRAPTPEERLMCAVLEHAIECLQKYRWAKSARDQRLRVEAWEWIEATQNDWPFSFERICEALGLDTAYLRDGLTARGWSSTPAGRNERDPGDAVLPV
jgi:hypothetical protein